MTQPDNRSLPGVTFRPWRVPLLALLAVLLRVSLPPSLVEAIYSRGLFVLLRTGWDHTLARLPVPLFYVFWLLVLFLAGRALYRWRQKRRQGQGGSWRGAGLGLLQIVSLLVLVFLLGWGFNYGRETVEERMGFTVYQPTLDELRARVYAEADTLARLRLAVTADTSAIGAAAFSPDLEQEVREMLRLALLRHDYPAPGRPRARQLYPRGLLLHLSTAGVYWPWAGEGNIDAGLHPLQKPPVMAHELAHAYGFGDEGTCTFWAWLAGAESTDPLLAYAFRLDYWRRLAGRLRQAEPEAYWAWREANLLPGIQNDLQSIYDNAAQYQDIAPVLRDVTYDAYLKVQGVQEGMLSYGRVVRMVEGYRRKE
ncbi:DUF3810 family protein [Neolewinella lacunae]|uniref:DUF3810 family protein n=1 Tax=Neolewinella lacunae TaxID=1517758 RepID=A0A923PGW5_9BACT|nr:DUF3810 family protein [Neolewinella lacunae]MBC6993059.1 DUF3810 family protein [Neolewinella lacunae]MDN3635881.1 DUF3810 family protein [Neolewinella lacunae]